MEIDDVKLLEFNVSQKAIKFLFGHPYAINLSIKHLVICKEIAYMFYSCLC